MAGISVPGFAVRFVIMANIATLRKEAPATIYGDEKGRVVSDPALGFWQLE